MLNEGAVSDGVAQAKGIKRHCEPTRNENRQLYSALSTASCSFSWNRICPGVRGAARKRSIEDMYHLVDLEQLVI